MNKGLKIGLAAAAVVIAAGAAVFGGCNAYLHSLQDNGRFLSRTVINGIDVSGKTPEQAGEYFAKQSLDRQVVLLEDGKEVLSHSLTELGYTEDQAALVKELTQCMESQKIDFDTVITGMTKGSAFYVKVPFGTDEETFNKVVTVDALSAPRKENHNAKILYYKEEKICKIKPEVQGTELENEDLQKWLRGEIDAVLSADPQEAQSGTGAPDNGEAGGTAAGETAAEEAGTGPEAGEAGGAGGGNTDGQKADAADSETGSGSAEEDNRKQDSGEGNSKEGTAEIVCEIPDSLYILPEKRADDESLQKKCELLNQYAGESITYVFGDKTETLTFDTIMEWLKIKDGQVQVRESKVKEYVRSLAEKYETRYMDRVFHTSLGTDVTFPGGLNEYGYTILEDQEVIQLTQDILSGESVEREPVYQTLGAWGDPLFLKRSGTDDLAGTYVEVSISAQHMWYYIDGSLFIESDVVTGDPTLNQDTATGVFPLAFKESPATLRGGEGKKKYTTKVQYWMPFYEGQGLHDAWWKSVFGGSEYMGNGSHGCVNLPTWVAESVFNNIVPGTAIVIYY